ncbi:MAG: YceD family protein [Gemmatimonadales bacterium]
MLRVDIRDLQRGPVRTDGELGPDDPVLQGLGLNLVGAVSVDGQLQATGEGEFLWRGSLHAVVRGECRRCLTEVLEEIHAEVGGAIFSTDPEAADQADFYPLPARTSSIDVSAVIREELALAVPTHLLLCSEGCAGLCSRCGADLNAGPCACRTSAEPV